MNAVVGMACAAGALLFMSAAVGAGVGLLIDAGARLLDHWRRRKAR